MFVANIWKFLKNTKKTSTILKNVSIAEEKVIMIVVRNLCADLHINMS